MSAINPDFESLRTALINSYSSQTTNHVGYVLALTVGIFVLISSKDFRELYNNHRIWFLLVLSLPISLIEYFASKIIFWAWMNTTVLTVTEKEALSSAVANNTTVIFGIQIYLTDIFKNIHEFSIYGISSTLYRLDQQVWFGLSFILLFALTFSLIYIFFGFWSEYYYAKSRKWLYYDAKIHKWYEWRVRYCVKCSRLYMWLLNHVKNQWLINAFKKRGIQIGIFVFAMCGLILVLLTLF